MMTIEELLTACAKQKGFPLVTIKERLRHANSNIGIVTVIKPTGCAVRFKDMGWDKWFWKEDQNDKRTHHMGEINLL